MDVRKYILLAILLFPSVCWATSIGGGSIGSTVSFTGIPQVSASTVTGNTIYTDNLIYNGVPAIDYFIPYLGATANGNMGIFDFSADTLYATGTGPSEFGDVEITGNTVAFGNISSTDRVSGNTIVADTLTLATGSITDSTGAISFGDESLTTTGPGTFGNRNSTTFRFLVTEAGVNAENTVALNSDALKGKAIAIQGSGGAYFSGRDVTNDVEFLMGTLAAGAASVGSMTNHPLYFYVNNSLAWQITTGGDLYAGAAGASDYDISTGGDITGDDGLFNRIGVNLDAAPIGVFHIQESDTARLLIQEDTGTTGDTAGIYFKTSSNDADLYWKAAIMQEDMNDGNVRGDLHICVDRANDTANVIKTDAQITIDATTNDINFYTNNITTTGKVSTADIDISDDLVFTGTYPVTVDNDASGRMRVSADRFGQVFIKGTATNRYGGLVVENDDASTDVFFGCAGSAYTTGDLAAQDSFFRTKTQIKFFTGNAFTTYSLFLDDDAGKSAYFTGNVTIGRGVAATDYTLTFDGENNDGAFKWMEDENYFEFMDKVLFDDAIYFTQTDGNEYIDSLNDGYVDMGATTGIRLNSALTRVTGDLYVGNNADADPAIVFDGDTSDGQMTYYEDTGRFGLSEPLSLTTGALLGSPVAGTFEFYNDRMYLTNVATQRVLDRTSDVALSTVTVEDTTDETTVFTGSIPANSSRAGNVLVLTMSGRVDETSAADTCTIRVYFGATLMTSLVSPGTGLSEQCWHINGWATVRSIGETGSMAWHLDMAVEGTSDATCGVSTIDTTNANDVTVTAQWNNAKAGNIFTLTQGFMEYKN